MNNAIQVIGPSRGERPNLVSITALELSIHRWRSRLFRKFGRGAVPGFLSADSLPCFTPLRIDAMTGVVSDKQTTFSRGLFATNGGERYDK